MLEISLITFGYLVGSIPTAYIVGKIVGNVDVRDYGSGNLGASNVWVNFGKVKGFFVGIFDILAKGALPVAIAGNLSVTEWVTVYVGIAAVAGHNWSIYLKFSGGRGVAVAGGVLLALSWPLFLISFSIASIGHFVFRNGGIWVGIALICIPVWPILFKESQEVIFLCFSLIIVLMLKRLFPNTRSNNTDSNGFGVYMNRLIYDRDTRNRDEWIHRSPAVIKKEG